MRLRQSGGRQGHHEFGAFAGLAFHSYRAAMGFHEFPHDREADSCASCGPAARFVDTIKLVEHSRQHVGGYSAAGVFDRQLDRASCGLFYRNGHRSSLWSVGKPVFDEVGDHLTDARAVSVYLRETVYRVEFNRYTKLGCPRLKRIDRVPCDGCNVFWL